jgi:4-amino-4-deoxy-L-arabinose transferase-like glycosyltransferase
MQPRVLLLLAIAFQIVVFVVGRRDVPNDDALAYADNAYKIGVDPTAYFQAPTNHPFVTRVGITLPLAAIFQVLGVSAWTTNLPSLLAAIVVLLVTYAAAPTARAKRIGLGFACASTALLQYGTELNADLLRRGERGDAAPPVAPVDHTASSPGSSRSS